MFKVFTRHVTTGDKCLSRDIRDDLVIPIAIVPIAIGIVLTGKVYHEAYRFSRFCFMVAMLI
jgi:hypothetical protein